MENIEIDFVEKFKLRELTLNTTKSWIISLRPQQPTLGSLILTLNRRCMTLSQINDDEGRALSVAFLMIEKMLNATFKPDKINYLALMMVDNQVHFHVIPRYKKTVLFEGIEFKDNSWPGPPSLEPIELNPTQMLNIVNLFKNCINSI